MNATYFLINTLFDLYLMVVLLRLWLQFAKADFYNPFSQFVVKATHPIVGPLRRLIPSVGRLDTATLVLALAIGALKLFVLGLLAGGTYTAPGLLLGAVFVILKEAFSLIFWVLIIRALLSWVNQGYNPIAMVMEQLTEPFLAPIRKIIPPAGGFDWSILVAIIALQFFQLLLQDFLRGF